MMTTLVAAALSVAACGANVVREHVVPVQSNLGPLEVRNLVMTAPALGRSSGGTMAGSRPDVELTKVWLRTGGPNGRWQMDGEGPAWTRFEGGAHGTVASPNPEPISLHPTQKMRSQCPPPPATFLLPTHSTRASSTLANMRWCTAWLALAAVPSLSWPSATNRSPPRRAAMPSAVAGLRFTVGSDFAVQYINELPEPTLIHAHGLTPPHGLDGVCVP